MCHMGMPTVQGESIQFPGTGATEGWEPHHMDAGKRTGPLQQVFLFGFGLKSHLIRVVDCHSSHG